MRSRRLGAKGPEVSVVGLGCNNFGWRIDPDQTQRVVDAAIDAGITLFDTADTYGATESESFLGHALGDRRDRVCLVTKFGLPVPDAPDRPAGSRDYVRWAVDGSLRRLRTDTIDVYMYHRPDGVTPLEETFAALAELVEEGRVRFLGVSNMDAGQLEEASTVADRLGAPLVTAESRYSLIRRDVEQEIVPLCLRRGLGLLPYYPLEGGLLTGKYRRAETPPEGSRFAENSTIWPTGRWLTEQTFDRVEALDAYGRDRGLSLLNVAVGGLAALPAVASVITGATTPEQVRANVAAADWIPTAEDLRHLAIP